MVREILDWTDEKSNEIMDNIDNEKHPYVKAFGLGMVEGVIDGLVYGGVLLLGLGLVAGIKKRKK